MRHIVCSLVRLSLDVVTDRTFFIAHFDVLCREYPRGRLWDYLGKSKYSRDGNLEKDAECDYFRINILSLEKTTNEENCRQINK